MFLFTSVLFNVLLILILCLKTDLCEKALAKIGLKDYDYLGVRHQIEYRCLEGWANCLNKQNASIDVVFYGNSITYESNFQDLFSELNICNLGCNRDDLDDLIHRSFIIKGIHPKKIFVLGGINNFISISLQEFNHKYSILVDTLLAQNPSSQLYLQSLLPVNVEMELGSRYIDCQEKIKDANKIIKTISQSRGCHFVDLYSAYQVNDSLPRKYTRDGLHLLPYAYAIWAEAITSHLQE